MNFLANGGFLNEFINQKGGEQTNVNDKITLKEPLKKFNYQKSERSPFRNDREEAFCY